MLRAFVLLTFLVVGHVAAQAPGVSIVRVEITSADGDTARTGIVVKGGRVAMTLEPTRNAASIRITTPDAVQHAATGVVAHNYHDNLVLLSVQWKGSPPPESTLSSGVSRATHDVNVSRGRFGDAELVLPARMTSVNPEWITLTLKERSADPSWGGAPIIDSGIVAGLITGPGDSGRSGGPARSLNAIRAECIAGLAEEKEIPLPDWSATAQKLEQGEVLSWKAAALSHADKLDKKGLAAAREAVALDPNNGYAWQLIAAGLMQEADWEAALTAAERAASICPTDSYPQHAISKSLAQLGKYEEALVPADKAIKNQPVDARLHTHKGYILEVLSRHEDALKSYKEALRLDPRDEYAQTGIERVRAALADRGGEDAPVRSRF